MVTPGSLIHENGFGVRSISISWAPKIVARTEDEVDIFAYARDIQKGESFVLAVAGW